jgi:hypothetical protein
VLGKKKSLASENLTALGEKVGRDIFKDNQKLCSVIYAHTQKMGEDVVLGRLYYYCAALLFVTSDLAATLELEKKNIDSAQDFTSGAFMGFMRLHKAKYDISREQFDIATHDISRYMKRIREAFIANYPSGSAMQVTKFLCETFANDLIQTFSLSFEVGSKSVNNVSKAVSDVWSAAVGTLK